MNSLLKIREWYVQIYSRYGVVVDVAVKFLGAFLSVTMINSSIGTMTILKNPAAALAISVLCAALPKSLMVLILAVFIVAHIYAVSLETAAFVLVVLVIMFMLYFRFSAGDSFVLILLPVLFLLKVPFIIPIALGLLATPFSMVSAAFGTIVYFIIDYISTNKKDMMTAGTEGLTVMSNMAKEIFTNQSMYLIIIAFSVVITAVYVIKKLSASYSWQIAAFVGTVINLVILIIGTIKFGVNNVFSMTAIIVGNIVSLLLSVLICFMVHNIDYSRTEHTQFEDDDYYYYVKAVPKLKAEGKGKKRRNR